MKTVSIQSTEAETVFSAEPVRLLRNKGKTDRAAARIKSMEPQFQ